MNSATRFTRSYHSLLQRLIDDGFRKPSRAKLSDGSQPDTLTLVGQSFHTPSVNPDDLPILLTRPVAVRNTIGELVTFLQGIPTQRPRDRRGPRTSVLASQFRDNGCDWWDAWADESDELGPIYGAQWRGLYPFYKDQIRKAVHLLINDPFSRRIFVSAWRPEHINRMALPPCHDSFCLVAEPTSHRRKHKIHMVVRMRSCDIMCGLPHNHLSYSILLNLFVRAAGRAVNNATGNFFSPTDEPMPAADECLYTPGSLTFQFSDLHVYENHLDAASTLLSRSTPITEPPRLEINEVSGMYSEPDDIRIEKPDDIRIENYNPAPQIPGIEVAV